MNTTPLICSIEKSRFSFKRKRAAPFAVINVRFQPLACPFLRILLRLAMCITVERSQVSAVFAVDVLHRFTEPLFSLTQWPIFWHTFRMPCNLSSLS
jgi:hypothetical protein